MFLYFFFVKKIGQNMVIFLPKTDHEHFDHNISQTFKNLVIIFDPVHYHLIM